jgi:ketosteroid isomerase-like protein
MDDTDDRFAALERRLAALEDERAIRHVFVRYGLAVDIGDVEATIALYTEDCHIDIDGVAFMDGRHAARLIVESDVHQAMMPYSAHVMGPFDVRTDGDHAVAIGYATVFAKQGEARTVWRQSFGKWELSRVDGEWLIARRISRSLGHAEAPAIAAEAIDRAVG